jgi:hypothetical protein
MFIPVVIFCFKCGLWFYDNTEKARIEAQIRAAEAATRRREETEMKRQREREREAARIELQKVYLLFTIEFVDLDSLDCCCLKLALVAFDCHRRWKKLLGSNRT